MPMRLYFQLLPLFNFNSSINIKNQDRGSNFVTREAVGTQASTAGRRSAMEDRNEKLRVVMLPWLAMGHLIPFFELSKRLAMNGVHVSIFSTPGNISRLPSVPQPLAVLLNFVPCLLSPIKNLSSNTDNTVDFLSEDERPLLHQAYTQFEHHLTAFLADPVLPKPDWIIYDITASSWIPFLAERHGLGSVLFHVFNAATFAFFGLSPAYDSPEELTKVPDYIPFPTTVAFRPFEARQLFDMVSRKQVSASSQPEVIPRRDLILIRTCREFEPNWLDLLGDIHCHRFPIVPVGFLPPSIDDHEKTDTWEKIREWLDERQARSVVYAAFGTEAKLSREQIEEVTVGLERCGLPFLLALRLGSLPKDFEKRNAGLGLILEGWVPQSRLLAHPSIGGFLTHGGWNSIVESLAAGVPMAVLPMMFEQGLNARHLAELGYAVEVPRDNENGHFSGEDIARALKTMVVEEAGQGLRMRAWKGKDIFGSEKVQREYAIEVVRHLRKHR